METSALCLGCYLFTAEAPAAGLQPQGRAQCDFSEKPRCQGFSSAVKRYLLSVEEPDSALRLTRRLRRRATAATAASATSRAA